MTFFLSNAALVSFPLSTLIANATTHLLYFTSASGRQAAPLPVASTNVAVFLSFFSSPFDLAMPAPFFLNDHFTASKLTLTPSACSPSMAKTLSFDFVHLLLQEFLSSKLLRVIFFGSFLPVVCLSFFPLSPLPSACSFFVV